MSEINIEVTGGSTIKLPTSGKYCDRDIIITATGGESVGPTTISTINLHDVTTDTQNVYISGSNVISYNSWNATDFIPVENGKYYLVYSTSAIDSKYCSKFNSSKTGASSMSGIINCSRKNIPLFLPGHDGYVRFSGTKSQINALEMYEVLNFNYSLD